MTTMIALPDLHDQSEILKKIARPLYEVDVVLLVGDMTNGSINHLLRLFAILEEFNEHIYAVNGNLDTEKMLAHLTREGISLHRRHELLDGLAFLGVGGALPFLGKFVFSEAQFASMLDETLQNVPPNTPKILVCHQPPFNTLNDHVGHDTHVGSHAVRAFIEREQPLICFTGHIHEGVGIDRIGDTLIINPGPLWQSGQYAFAEVIDGRVVTAELRSISSPTSDEASKRIAPSGE
jgi:uncharacterized protein